MSTYLQKKSILSHTPRVNTYISTSSTRTCMQAPTKCVFAYIDHHAAGKFPHPPTHTYISPQTGQYVCKHLHQHTNTDTFTSFQTYPSLTLAATLSPDKSSGARLAPNHPQNTRAKCHTRHYVYKYTYTIQKSLLSLTFSAYVCVCNHCTTCTVTPMPYSPTCKPRAMYPSILPYT